MSDRLKPQVAQTAFRGLLSLIFLVAGFQHLLNPDHVALRISKTPLADLLVAIMPLNLHAFLAGIGLVAGGLGLLFGSKTRLSALVLMSILIPITITVQTDSAETLGPLFKNIAIFGGLIHFAYFGIGQGLGVDRISLNGKPMSLYFSTAKIAVVAVIAGLLTSSLRPEDAAEAASQKSDAKDVVILVQKEKHVQVAIETLIQGQSKGSHPRVRRGTVLVCGKEGVGSLTDESKSKEQVQKADKAGLQVVACGLSLKEAGLSRESLLSGVSIVENGLWEMIRLQSSGYVSVEL